MDDLQGSKQIRTKLLVYFEGKYWRWRRITGGGVEREDRVLGEGGGDCGGGLGLNC